MSLASPLGARTGISYQTSAHCRRRGLWSLYESNSLKATAESIETLQLNANGTAVIGGTNLPARPKVTQFGAWELAAGGGTEG